MTKANQRVPSTRVVAHVRSKCSRDGNCLTWTMGLHSNGRPVFGLSCCKESDPRMVLWIAAGNERKPGYVFAEPECGVLCLEPKHQLYMPRGEAMALAAARGKMAAGAKWRTAKAMNAARSRRHVVLNWEKVRAMRARYAETGNAKQVAEEFGVKHQHAHRVVRNQAWREATWVSGLAG